MHFLVRYSPKEERKINKEEFINCKYEADIDPRPFEYTLSLIGGKWKLNILFWLWRKDIMRYNE